MSINFEIYFLLFILYSFLGWCIEVVLKFIEYKRFINRGFFIGPYCPIYGIGALVITILFNNHLYSPFITFLLGMLICSTIEYLTSFLLEKIFHARWWDYSKNMFNINGRVCLKMTVPMGIAVVVMLYYINPFLIDLFSSINEKTLNILFISIISILLVDVIISLIVLLDVRKDTKVLIQKDNTEEMRKKVIDKIISQGVLFKRLFTSFPNFMLIGKVIKLRKNKRSNNE